MVPAADPTLKTADDLLVAVLDLRRPRQNGRPDATIEYNFHQKTGDGEKFFNKTQPQVINQSTLPPGFNVKAGHQVLGFLGVPLKSFRLANTGRKSRSPTSCPGRRSRITRRLRFKPEERGGRRPSMTRHFTVSTLVVLACVVTGVRSATAQSDARMHAATLVQAPATPHAVVQGTVLDDRGRPLEGVVVSAFGSTSVFAVSDPEGRFSFRSIPYGPYVVRAHLQGYLPPRGRLIQVNSATLTVAAIALTRRGESDGDAAILLQVSARVRCRLPFPTMVKVKVTITGRWPGGCAI